jgi:hypothetical protein
MHNAHAECYLAASFKLRITIKSILLNDRNYAQCRSDKCHFAGCHFGKCHGVMFDPN